MQMNLLTQENISKLKSIYIKLMLNFIQIFSLLNFFSESEEESSQKTINKTFEVIGGYFFNIIFFDCVLQGKQNIKRYIYN